MQNPQRRQPSQQKRSIMDYLPENQRAKLIKLVERLGEETQIKEKFQALYEQEHQKYIHLQEKYRLLEESYEELKSHMATSRMAINKAKQAYMASKSAKKIRKVELQENEDNKQTQNLKQTWLRIPKSAKKMEDHPKNQYIFQESESQIRQRNFPGNTEPIVSYPLVLKTDEKSQLKMNIQNSNKNDLSMSLSKKQQIMNLRKQIDMLSESMLKNERKGMPIDEKVKKCNEIKKRYIKSKEKDHQKLNFEQEEERAKVGSNHFGFQNDSDEESQMSHRQTVRTNKKQQQQQKTKNMRQTSSEEEENNEIEVYKAKNMRSFKTSQHEMTNQKRLKGEKQDKQQKKERQRSKKRAVEKSYQEDNHRQTSRSGKIQIRGQIESKFDESLFAIIDQLNS